MQTKTDCPALVVFAAVPGTPFAAVAVPLSVTYAAADGHEFADVPANEKSPTDFGLDEPDALSVHGAVDQTVRATALEVANPV